MLSCGSDISIGHCDESKGIKTPSITIESYFGQHSSCRVVLATAPNPQYGINIIIPTRIKDHRGLPHTLEHLIFIGSANYPERGYLDKLATLCLSDGTNAYTADDHTCYTASTPSFKGLINLLPVYIDHVLRPIITDDSMYTEVFGFSPDGNDPRGVVYSEMKGIEFSEQAQMDLRLRHNLWDNAAEPMDTYRWECGGLSNHVAWLTRKEIVDYHDEFYKHKPLTILIIGPDFGGENKVQLLDCIERAMVESRTCPNTHQSPFISSITNPVLFETELGLSSAFPSDAEESGSVGFAWKGPPVNDHFTILAVEVLLHALVETSASPLSQCFIQTEEGICTDIEYEIRLLQRTMITLIFEGVTCSTEDEVSDLECDQPDGPSNPNLKTIDSSDTDVEPNHNWLDRGKIKARLFALLHDLITTERGSEWLRESIKIALEAILLEYIEQIEENPHELVISNILPDILFTSHQDSVGRGFEQVFTNLKLLGEKSIEFWSELVKSFLLTTDPIEVTMHPSNTMANQINQLELDNISKLRQERQTKPEPVQLSSVNDPTPSRQLDDSLDCIPENLSVQSLGKISSFIANPQLDQNKASFYEAIKFTQVESTTFNHVEIGLCVYDCVDESLWPYLALFQKLIFHTNLLPTQQDYISPGHFCFNDNRGYSLIDTIGPTPTYQQVQKFLACRFLSTDASIGQDRRPFSIGSYDTHLFISGSSLELGPREIHDTLMDILFRSEFSAERVRITAENLLGGLFEAKRDQFEILTNTFITILGEKQSITTKPKLSKKSRSDYNTTVKRNIEYHLTIFQQEPLLNQILSSPIEETIEKLNLIKQQLLSTTVLPKNHILHIGCASLDKFDAFGTKPLMEPCLINSFQVIDSPIPRYGHSLLFEPNSFDIAIVQMSTANTSYLTFSVPVNILSLDPEQTNYDFATIVEYQALSLLCQLLSYTEGPLYNHIRGGGLAYGAGFSLSLYTGLLSVHVGRCTDAVAGYIAIMEFLCQLLREAEDDGNASILSPRNISIGKAMWTSSFIMQRSTPTSIVDLSLRNSLRSLPPIGSVQEREWVDIIQNLTQTDLKRVIKTHVPKFFTKIQSTLVLVSPSIVDKVLDGFSKYQKHGKLTCQLYGPF